MFDVERCVPAPDSLNYPGFADPIALRESERTFAHALAKADYCMRGGQQGAPYHLFPRTLEQPRTVEPGGACKFDYNCVGDSVGEAYAVCVGASDLAPGTCALLTIGKEGETGCSVTFTGKPVPTEGVTLAARGVMCLRADGLYCSTAGRCERGAVPAGGACKPGTDATCIDGTFCSYDELKSDTDCAELSPDGAKCLVADTCKSGHCHDAQCQPRPLGGNVCNAYSPFVKQ